MPNEQTVSTESAAPETSTPAESAEQKDLFEGYDFGSMDFADTTKEKEPRLLRLKRQSQVPLKL